MAKPVKKASLNTRSISHPVQKRANVPIPIRTTNMGNAQRALLQNLFNRPTPVAQKPQPTASEQKYQWAMKELDHIQNMVHPKYAQASSNANMVHTASLIQKYFPKEEWNNAYRVMQGESGGNPQAIGDNYPIAGQTIPSYGLFQIRGLPGRPNPSQLLDPEFNVAYAARMQREQGWSPWTVARNLGISDSTSLARVDPNVSMPSVENLAGQPTPYPLRGTMSNMGGYMPQAQQPQTRSEIASIAQQRQGIPPQQMYAYRYPSEQYTYGGYTTPYTPPITPSLPMTASTDQPPPTPPPVVPPDTTGQTPSTYQFGPISIQG